MRFKSALITAAAALPVVALLLWLSGCDFTHVDEPSHVPIKQVLTSLQEADTEAEMKEAVDRLLGKLEIGTPGKEGPYSNYKLTAQDRDALVSAQLAYKTDAASEGLTFRVAYEIVKRAEAEASTIDTFTPLSRPELTVAPEAALGVLSSSIDAALENAESPSAALLVALAANGPEIPAEAPTFTPDQQISPIQKFLFGVWLHYYGPALSDVLTIDVAGKGGGGGHGGNNKNECPVGFVLVDKFESPENGNGMTWEKGTHTIQLSNFTYKEGVEVATFDWFSPTYYVDLVQFKGGTNIERIFLPRQKSGSVSFVDVGRKGISNVLFCQYEGKKTCWTGCLAEYVACNLCNGGDEAECRERLKTCMYACEHPQGNIH